MREGATAELEVQTKKSEETDHIQTPVVETDFQRMQELAQRLDEESVQGDRIHPPTAHDRQRASEWKDAMDYLINTPEAAPIVALDTEIGVAGEQALQKTREAFQEIEGATLVWGAAEKNMYKQMQELDIAAAQVLKGKPATVSVFGAYKTFHTIDEVVGALERMRADFQIVAALPPGFDAFRKNGLSVLDKYLFDSRNLEAAKDTQVKTLILEDPRDYEPYDPEYQKILESLGMESKHHRGLAARLVQEGIFAENEIQKPEGLDGRFDNGTIAVEPLSLHGAALDVFDQDFGLPEMIVVNVSTEKKIKEYHERYQALYRNYLTCKFQDRPAVVMYTDTFTPTLHDKWAYEGFLFCSTPDELRSMLCVAKELTALKQKPDDMQPEALAPLQQSQYDKSTDLREWEHITADTYQSLAHLLERFQMRNSLYQEAQRRRSPKYIKQPDGSYIPSADEKNSLIPQRPIKTILDIGTGEGRIAGMLARLGFNVVGMDISPEMLKKAKERIKAEGQGLRGEREDPTLSYPALQRLQKEGKLPQAPILDDAEAQAHFVTAKGSFFDLEYGLNKFKTHMYNPEFFNDPGAEYREYGSLEDAAQDLVFDAATMNWHTLDEVGDSSNQQDVLIQIFNQLERGGELTVEVPDTMVDPYASAIKDYHDTHPDEPFGTHKDTYTAEDGTQREYSPRYFPNRNELVVLLQSVGFEIDPQKDIQTYLITSKDPKTGKERLQVKELFITARKPKV